MKLLNFSFFDFNLMILWITQGRGCPACMGGECIIPKSHFKLCYIFCACAFVCALNGISTRKSVTYNTNIRIYIAYAHAKSHTDNAWRRQNNIVYTAILTPSFFTFVSSYSTNQPTFTSQPLSPPLSLK